jgi:hypothetical protein
MLGGVVEAEGLESVYLVAQGRAMAVRHSWYQGTAR